MSLQSLPWKHSFNITKNVLKTIIKNNYFNDNDTEKDVLT